MKFYSNESIQEGDYYPNAWIWHGSIRPLVNNAPKGWALRIKLPWWIRKHSSYHCKDMAHQLMFGVLHFSGGVEMYEIWFNPVEGV